VNIKLPALRQRVKDIPLLSAHFIKKYADERQAGKPISGFDPDVERLFLDYPWPGNVRELENIIERAMVMCPGETITIQDLPREFRDQIKNTLHLDGIPVDAKLYETLAWVERRMIERAMRMADNVQTRAAEILGIGKSGLNQKLKKYKL
jgi:two-component system NtrC family response regulator